GRAPALVAIEERVKGEIGGDGGRAAGAGEDLGQPDSIRARGTWFIVFDAERVCEGPPVSFIEHLFQPAERILMRLAVKFFEKLARLPRHPSGNRRLDHNLDRPGVVA